MDSQYQPSVAGGATLFVCLRRASFRHLACLVNWTMPRSSNMSQSMTPSPVGEALLGWGFRIVSALPIPGAISWPWPEAKTDVTVIDSGVCAQTPWPDLYRRAEPWLEFTPPGVARYRIRQDTILVERHPLAAPEDVSELLIATAIPALLWSRGLFMLHAAGLVLMPQRRCIAIAGASGVGKSSLAHWFLDQGARLVGDDTLAVEMASETALCRGLPGGVFRTSNDARQFEPLTGKQIEKARATALDAIVVLAPGQSLAMHRLAGIEAFSAVMRNRHRPRVPELLGRQNAMLAAASAVCRTTPVYELQFDKKTHSPQELGALIRAYLRGMGADDPIHAER